MTPLTNFMSSLLRLGIEAKVAQEGQASNVEKMLENINNAIQHANQLSSQINATGNKPHYYSLNTRASDFGYQPSLTSLQGVVKEMHERQ